MSTPLFFQLKNRFIGSFAWLGLAIVLPIVMLIPVLVWPHYGLFTDAEQAIMLPRDFYTYFPGSLAWLSPLPSGRWNPMSHLITIGVFGLFPDSPRALYVMQALLLIGTLLGLAYLVRRITGSSTYAILAILLYSFSSGFFENYFTLDKFEPRMVFLLVFLLLSLYHQFASTKTTHGGAAFGFVAIQICLGVVLIFSKETGIFFAIALGLTWLGVRRWEQSLLVKKILATLTWATLAQIAVCVLFAALFGWLAKGMNYQYVSYPLNFWQWLDHLGFYLLRAPEMGLGLLCAVGWIYSNLFLVSKKNNPSSQALMGIISWGMWIYFIGISFWRWALEYYLLPLSLFNAILLSVSFYQCRPRIKQIIAGLPRLAGWMIKAILVLAVLSYVYIRLITGIFVYQEDALKDELAQLLASPQWHSSRIVLPFTVPESAEVGERLEYFINNARGSEGLDHPIALYNFWEPPERLNDITRFEGGAGSSPSKSQLTALAKLQTSKTVIWSHKGLYSANKRSEDTPLDPWVTGQFQIGDLILIPSETSLPMWIQARGIGMYFLGQIELLNLNKLLKLELRKVIKKPVGISYIRFEIVEILEL